MDYANDSSVEVTNASLVDTLPADVTCNTYSINGAATVDCTGQNPININLGTLAGFESGSVEMNVTVGAAYASTSLLNSATLTVTAPDGSNVNKTAESTIAVDVPVAAFTLEKTSDVDFVAIGSNVVFTIVYTNYGGATAIDVNLTDILPQGFVYVSSSPSATPNADGTYSWALGDVLAGGTGSVTIEATAVVDLDYDVVPAPFAGSNPATNTATLTWANPNGGGSVDAEDIVGLDAPMCTRYYFTNVTNNVGFDGVQNTAIEFISGLTAYSETTTIGDKNSPEVILNEFYMDSVSQEIDLNDGDYTMDILLDFSTPTSNKINVYVSVYDYNVTTGASTLIEKSTVSSPGASGKPTQYQVSNAFNIPPGNRLLWIVSADSTKNTGSDDLTITYNHINGSLLCKAAPATMAVSKTVNTASIATVGATTPIVYTIDYANTSATAVTNANIVDTLPTSVTFASATLNGVGIVPSISGQTLTFTGGDLASISSGTSGQLLINATVTAAALGTLTNLVVVSSDNAADVNDTTQTTVGPISATPPSLNIIKSVDKTYISAGESVTYTLTVVNTGGKATDITVLDNIPQDTYFNYLSSSINGSTDGTGTVSSSDTNSPDLNWTIDALAQGEVATLTFSMVASASGIPVGVIALDNNATLLDAEYCTDISISGCTSNIVTVSLSGNPVINIDITADAPTKLAGETITYTVDYNNTGSADADNTQIVIPAPNNTVIDPNSLPAGASFDGTNNQIIVDLTTLVSGGNGTFDFNVTINEPMPTGSTSIIAEATISASNALSDVDTVEVTVLASIDLVVNISGPSSAAYPSSTLSQAASADTTISVEDASQFTPGQVIRIGGTYVTIVSISGKYCRSQ